MPVRRAVRVWTMLWALLQFALPTAATYADVLLERWSAKASVAHVEADGGAGCPAVHPADCALCHAAQRLATPGGATACAAFASLHVLRPDDVTVAPQAAERGRLPLSRAPPAA